MTDNEDIQIDEMETNIADEQNDQEVNVVVQDDEQSDEALRVAQQALEEIRHMRQEQDDEWKREVNQTLRAILERLNSMSSEPSEASEPDETLEIETPPAPRVTSRRRKKRRLKF